MAQASFLMSSVLQMRWRWITDVGEQRLHQATGYARPRLGPPREPNVEVPPLPRLSVVLQSHVEAEESTWFEKILLPEFLKHLAHITREADSDGHTAAKVRSVPI